MSRVRPRLRSLLKYSPAESNAMLNWNDNHTLVVVNDILGNHTGVQKKIKLGVQTEPCKKWPSSSGQEGVLPPCRCFFLSLFHRIWAGQRGKREGLLYLTGRNLLDSPQKVTRYILARKLLKDRMLPFLCKIKGLFGTTYTMISAVCKQ